MKKQKSVCLILDPNKSLNKVNTMNMLAETCKVLHADPEIGTLSIHILGPDGKKAKHMFDFKLK